MNKKNTRTTLALTKVWVDIVMSHMVRLQVSQVAASMGGAIMKVIMHHIVTDIAD